jgi:hypothetical protein
MLQTDRPMRSDCIAVQGGRVSEFSRRELNS